ncbi:IS3 family transposase [Xaviernesmea oryzae]|uniref:IS3 family transposase n=1 Tax=Xaviernesmea oryzae TaxID=464029 RepID=UPI003C6F52CC
MALIEDIQDELPCYGYRRVTHELQRRGHLVNHKRVAPVMRINGLEIKPRKRYVRTTDSDHDSPIYRKRCLDPTFRISARLLMLSPNEASTYDDYRVYAWHQ